MKRTINQINNNFISAKELLATKLSQNMLADKYNTKIHRKDFVTHDKKEKSTLAQVNHSGVFLPPINYDSRV